MEKECNQIIDDVCEYICHEWSIDRINTCDDFKKIASELKKIYAKENELKTRRHRGR